MKSICVYCGSNAGSDPRYAEAARALGRRIANEGAQLVYGGGNVGLMGIVADAVLAAGGEVTGIIPHQLMNWEVGHRGLTRLEVVDSMHERKARMFELSDAFIALPGGFGTLDEMFEMLTWRQLGLGKKPCAFLDIADFWKPLMSMLDHMVGERFLHPEQRQDLWHGTDIDALFAWMRDYRPAQADKWMDEKRRGQLHSVKET
ncbi:MAG: TIGR00730 family Rossman fold protein [Proteobacteria bacterium]|nr:TIGR00730 family Rossman fold protein [Pseudomonadota bacterium]